MIQRILVLLLVAFSWSRLGAIGSTSAAVTLAPVFGDHMVLQRGQSVPIWGTADAGEAIQVTLADVAQSVIADADGNWMARFDPRPASDRPVTLVVVASNTIAIEDILIGDVWLCSGQSNMHWPLRQAAGGGSDVPGQGLANLRLLNLRGEPYPTGHEFTDQEFATCAPEKYLTGRWTVSGSQAAADFSAVAYYFGQDLLSHQKVPIGLIHNAIGGTPTESWVNRESLGADSQLSPLLDHWLENELVGSFCRERAAMNLGQRVHHPSFAMRPWQHPYQLGFMYEAGIAPLKNFPIRGVIWYQGESNTHNPLLHERLFTTMVADWRRAWGRRDLPFLFVQLPNLESAANWPEFRASQLRCSRIPNTGMAVTIDVGDPADVHPGNKRDVGQRLALIARGLVYGESIEYSGPVPSEAQTIGNKLRLRFTHATGGLASKGGAELRAFEVAGRDGNYVPATASIEGDAVILFSPEVAEPVAVRYAFAANPQGLLINGAGLPASPFRWPGDY